MTCAELKAELGAFALDALEPEERAACESHLAEPIAHQGCREAWAAALWAADALSAALPPERPSAEVWGRIERRVNAIRAQRPRGLAWRERIAWAAAAAAIAVAALSEHQRSEFERRARASSEQQLAANHATREANANTLEARSAREACARDLELLRSAGAAYRDAIALLERPGTRVVNFAPQAGKAYLASAIVNEAANRALVISSAMVPQLGKDFELWVIRGKTAPVPAGFMKEVTPGLSLGEIDRTLLAKGLPDAFAVSLEPTGGRPTPTEVLLIGATRPL